jgi:hypothetical protein
MNANNRLKKINNDTFEETTSIELPRCMKNVCILYSLEPSTCQAHLLNNSRAVSSSSSNIHEKKGLGQK